MDVLILLLFSRCEESEGAVYLSDHVWLVGAVGTGC